MAIDIRSVERGNQSGVKKCYENPVQGKDMSLVTLTKGIEKTGTVNGMDIRAVLYAIAEKAADNLSEGRIIRLGDWGNLRKS